jgi:hypothetical protein
MLPLPMNFMGSLHQDENNSDASLARLLTSVLI